MQTPSPILWAAACTFLPSLAVPALAQENPESDPFQALVRPTEWQAPEVEEKSFSVPEGFSVNLFASEPMINKPFNLAFDERGRLWVTTSTEYPWPAAKERWEDEHGTRVRDSADAIKILEDTDGDGRADKVTTFADGLNVPIGVLPYGRGCIAWSIPNIWYFEDTDGDGVCDRRQILFGPLGYERDTHGNIASLRLGEDGWVYATHGFNNVSRIEVRPENRRTPLDESQPRRPTPNWQNAALGPERLDWGNSVELSSGNVFRFRPDGSAVEIWAWGQVNPFGLTEDGWGNLYSADCHSNPMTQLIRCANYPSFGRPHDGMGFGPVMCEHSHGSTGICGPLYLFGGVWGPEWDHHFLVCNPVTSRINHDLITWTGATAKANELPDFMTSTDPWFRPVDIQLGPDGALYVADFYNRIIGHYEVDLNHPGRDRTSGRIWRVSQQGVTTLKHEITPEQAAARRLRREGPVAPVTTPHAAKALLEYRIGHPQVDAIPEIVAQLRQVPADDPVLRHTARLALRAAASLSGGFAKVLETPGAEALTPDLLVIARSIQTPEASRWLFDQVRKNPQLDRGELRLSLVSLARSLPEEQQGELVAFVQSAFAQELETQLDLFEAITQGVAQRGGRPVAAVLTWGGRLAEHYLRAEADMPVTAWEPAPGKEWEVETRSAEDGQTIAVLSSHGAAGEQYTGTLRSPAIACPPRFSFWLCGHRGFPNQLAHEKNFARLVDAETGEELHRAWPPRSDVAQKIEWDMAAHAGRPVRFELVDGDDGSAYAWLGAGRFAPAVLAVPPADAGARGRRLATLATFAAEQKLTALVPTLAALLSRGDVDDATKAALAQALADFQNPKVIAEALRTAPARLQATLAEILAGSVKGARELLLAGSPRLLTLPAVAQKIAALPDADLHRQVEEATRDLPPANEEAAALVAARLREFLAARAAGQTDLERGRRVFDAQCALCHQLGGRGQVVGPQLDGVGNRGVERLCEDILDPNREIDPMFYLRLLTLKDGTVVSGLMRRVEGAQTVLADATGRETAVANEQIAESQEMKISLMPPTFGQTLSPQEFSDLLAFLLSQVPASHE